MIEAYFSNLEQTIRQFTNIRFLSLTKKSYNVSQGYISGSIIFENNYRLDFVEVKNTNMIEKIKYRYHYMNENQTMIFRYDNALHHIDISTFPHHKHEFDSIKASIEPSIYDVLLEIAENQRNLKL